MFSKPGKPMPPPSSSLSIPPTPQTPLAEPPRKSPAKIASLIAPDMTIEGGVMAEGELQVDGAVKGDIRVLRLTIGETGHIEGSVQAEVVEVRGRVIGAIIAKQVRLYGTAHVDGDITHEQLAMETGAFFQGRSLKFQRPAAPPQAPAPAPAIAPPQTRDD